MTASLSAIKIIFRAAASSGAHWWSTLEHMPTKFFPNYSSSIVAGQENAASGTCIDDGVTAPDICSFS